MTRLCRFTVFSSVSILLATLLASTGGAAGGSPGSFPTGLAELCNLDCVVRGEIPDRGDGSPFEFVLGLATVESGLRSRTRSSLATTARSLGGGMPAAMAVPMPLPP